MTLLHTTYFGSVDWYRELLCANPPSVINDKERWVKQSSRNHCVIAAANGVQKLTVPVTIPKGGVRSKEEGAWSNEEGVRNVATIRDVRISDHGNWRHQHWEAMKSAYGMSPFFEYYADDIVPFFEKRWDFLYDYNEAIMHKMLDLIGWNAMSNATIAESNGATITESNGATITESEYSGVAQSVATAPRPTDTTMPPVGPYYQTFQRRHGFIPGLSILDLLFNEGPEALNYIVNMGMIHR